MRFADFLRCNMSVMLLCLGFASGCGGNQGGKEGPGDTSSQTDTGPDSRVDTLPTSISPGVGVGMRGQTLLLGDTLAAMRQKLGEPTALRPMGAAGTEFEYETAFVGGLLQGEGDQAKVTAIYLFAGFSGKTEEGLGLGSTMDQWESAYGQGVTTPFSAAKLYPEAGLGADFADGNVVRIHVVASTTNVSQCPPKAPFGTDVGQRMADLKWTDADGNTVRLHDMCGAPLLLAYHFYGW